MRICSITHVSNLTKCNKKRRICVPLPCIECLKENQQLLMVTRGSPTYSDQAPTSPIKNDVCAYYNQLPCFF